jgi:hypothetical protein
MPAAATILQMAIYPGLNNNPRVTQSLESLRPVGPFPAGRCFIRDDRADLRVRSIAEVIIPGGAEATAHAIMPKSRAEAISSLYLFLLSARMAALTASIGDSIGGSLSKAKMRRLSLPSIGDDQA